MDLPMLLRLRLSILGLLLLLLAVADAAPAPGPAPADNLSDNVPPSQEKWTWCVDNSDDLAICTPMVKILDAIDTDTDHTHSCVQAAGDDACMQMLKDGTALYTVLDGGEIWEGYNEYDLVPLRTAYSDVDIARYYGVGVVNADKCPNSISDLKGLASCHTGYGRASGWTLPISFLLNGKYMAVATEDKSKPHDLQSVENFFVRSCAASDEADEEICTACKTTTNCTEEDLYYDYAGSFRCLVEGSGDISFTKGVIPGMYAKGGTLEQSDWTNLKDATQYKILCPNNTEGNLCADVSAYTTCNFGTAPGHTIMVSKELVANERKEFNAVMDAANSNPEFLKLFSANNYSNSEFASGVAKSIIYNGTVEELLGTLYQNIQYLDNINANTTNSTSNGAGATSKWAAPMKGGLIAATFTVVGLFLML